MVSIGLVGLYLTAMQKSKSKSSAFKFCAKINFFERIHLSSKAGENQDNS
jgi:hypothetical protein